MKWKLKKEQKKRTEKNVNINFKNKIMNKKQRVKPQLSVVSSVRGHAMDCFMYCKFTI